MKKGTKKSPVSKEELERQLKFQSDKRLIKDEFYPALKEATTSVDEASMLLSAMASLVMEEALDVLRSRHMEDIRSRFTKKLCPDNERLLHIEKLLKIFDKHTLFDARGLFEGMKSLIEQMKLDEMRSRKLDTMKVDWDRYLNK